MLEVSDAESAPILFCCVCWGCLACCSLWSCSSIRVSAASTGGFRCITVTDLQARQVSQSLRCLLQVLSRGGYSLQGAEVDNIPAAQDRSFRETQQSASLQS